MKKIDLKKTISSYKAKSGEFAIVDIPPLHYLMIDGDNGPASTHFMSAIQALYPVAYKLKFMSKLNLDRDYVVPPLEGLWWAEDMSVFTTNYDKSKWQWTAMILTPDWIPGEMFAASAAVGLAIGAMYYLGCIHPPGGATALSAVVGGDAVYELGYLYVISPVLINVLIILMVGIGSLF